MHSVAQYMCRRGYFPFNVDKNESISILCEDAFHFVDWMFFVHTILHASLTLCVPDMICKRTWGGAWLVLVIDKRTRKAQDFAEINNPTLNSKSTILLIPFWLTFSFHFPSSPTSHCWPTKFNNNATYNVLYSNLLHFSVSWMNFFSLLHCALFSVTTFFM